MTLPETAGIVDQAFNLDAPKRLWMLAGKSPCLHAQSQRRPAINNCFAGVTLMDVPGTQPPLTVNDIPIFASLPYTSVVFSAHGLLAAVLME